MPAIRNKLKPWIISSETELLMDDMQRLDHLKSYLKRNPFPGVQSDVPTKAKWLKAIDEHHMQIMEDSFYESGAPEAADAARDILLNMAPELIQANFTLSSNFLDTLATALGEEQKTAFVQNFHKYCDSGSETTPHSSFDTFEKCLLWIKENKQLSSSSSSVEFIIATIKVAKDTRISEFYKKTLCDLGIANYIKTINLGVDERSIWSWGVQDKVGENMYCGDGDNDNDGVHWNMRLSICNTEPESSLDETQKDVRAFSKLLKDQVAASNARGNPKCYTLIKSKDAPDDDSDEGDDSEDEEDHRTPQIPEYYQPLWLPKAFTKHHSRIACHMSSGEGECRYMQQRLEKGTTDSGNLKIELFEYELQHAKKIQTTKEKFCAVLALSLAASNDDYWMHDNENPQAVTRLIKSLAVLWKSSLLLENDINLGIGLEDGTEEKVDGDGLTTSRALLYQFLGQIATNLENHVPKFQWKPVAKKRKA